MGTDRVSGMHMGARASASKGWSQAPGELASVPVRRALGLLATQPASSQRRGWTGHAGGPGLPKNSIEFDDWRQTQFPFASSRFWPRSGRALQVG